MTKDQCIDVLGVWEGYDLGTVGRVEGQEARNADEPEVWIELLPDPDHPRRCSGCGRAGLPIHDLNERWVRDLRVHQILEGTNQIMRVIISRDMLRQ